MTVETTVDDRRSQFPVGMRVLAVDDDPTCLKVLETLLRRCQYHVTTTSQAIMALKMLRENKNKFDLVISDVHMPDMDGFKLLELVGLEMDLPVIMLSGNGDTKLVMKGITHGACDYLLKPVRIEELKNIWQHVIRRKKFDSKDCKNSGNQDKSHIGNGEGGPESAETGNSDQNGKLNKKRKDQDEDEDEDRDENDNDDPSTQKKPRVVWSVELHRKFVAAVNQLGIDKAVPKKILDLMNVEKLTRENKYRLYLKRISCVANQQANMVAALGSSDSSYLRMSSMNGLGSYTALSGSVQFQSPAFRSFPPSGMIGRLNTPAGMGLHCLPSSGRLQLGHPQNLSNSTDQVKFHPATVLGKQNGNMLQRMPVSFELDQQNSKGVTHIGEFSTAIDDTPIFPLSNGLPDAKITGNSSNSALAVSTSSMMLGNLQDDQCGRKFGGQSSVSMTSLKSEFCSPLPDHGRCTENWSSSAQLSGYQSNSLLSGDRFKQASTHPSSLRDNLSVMASQMGSNRFDVSSVTSASTQFQDLRTDIQGQQSAISSNAGQTINEALIQGWDNQKPDSTYPSNIMCSSMNSLMPVNDAMGPLEQSLDSKNSIFDRSMDFNLIGQSNYVDPLIMKHDEVEKPTMETSLRSKQGYLLDQKRPQGSYISNTVGSLEDLVSAMMKQEQDKAKSMEGEFDAYSLGPSM
ncbi:hypothetical protein FEM48_Zijuj06G0069800 [Ziziphus jujuba var. spinosa]|uniref:Two-component response regulator n=1 Tax=Ziziphus jujuba var. spinosa TaxID=714518 RepID=A0A978V7U5_ZIZJJ|nr:hypothetical protein FEM48_Zijuj06G0069800 [Ziziphus jujuba var. spinosa]